MIEQELADRFKAAVANEPPLGFDPDGLADHAARMERRRAAVLGASTAAAAVAIGAVTVLQLVRVDQGPAGEVGPVAPSSKTADPCPPDTKTVEPEQPKTMEPELPKTEPKTSEATEPKSGEDKPADPCASNKPGADGPFTGWEEAKRQVEQAANQVFAERVSGRPFKAVNWTPDAGRCLAGAYQEGDDGYRVVALTVCHNQKTGLDLKPLEGDWGSQVSDTTMQDGSHVVVYRFEGDGTGGLSVRHHRTDGVIVQASTSFKTVRGQNGPLLSQEQLTAIATDGRLRF